MARRRGAAEHGGAGTSRCGLCGRFGRVRMTACCGRSICDDQEKYVIFSFARNSCSGNHDRYTLCGFHHNESHAGRWQECRLCRDSFATEIFVYYGTNEYNFEKLENPPKFEPTKCSRCGKVIALADGGYSRRGSEYACPPCTAKEFGGLPG